MQQIWKTGHCTVGAVPQREGQRRNICPLVCALFYHDALLPTWLIGRAVCVRVFPALYAT